MSATLTRPRKAAPRLTKLHEDFSRSSAPERVDREAGIVFGVRVCGRQSPNSHGKAGASRTEYTLEALREAMPLYEGIPVFKNHPARERPNVERKIEESIGWLKNVRLTDDGLVVDLHLLTADPDTAKILEAAEKNPSCFGLSHNAWGEGDVRDGVFYIRSIPQVRSVDLVTTPATANSLFESMEPPMKTPRKLLEGGAVKAPAALAVLTRLCEDDAYADMATDAPADDWKGSLVAAISALVQSGDEADHAKAKKIMALLKNEPEEAPVPESEDKKDDEKKAMESRDQEARLAALKRENTALRLCMESKAELSPVALKAVCLQESEAEMKALIAEFAPRTQVVQRPRSTGPVPVVESTDTYAEFVQRLTGRAPAAKK